MIHGIEGLAQERVRVSVRPAADSETPVLAYFELEVIGSASAYASRLRDTLAAVYELAMQEDMDAEEVPVQAVPVWFVNVCRGGIVHESFAIEGREAYIARTGGDPWDLQDWLSRFHPELEARGWAFWDVTRSPGIDGRLLLWVDAWGESFFAWEELRWLTHVCGASSVEGPRLAKSEVWAREVSV